MNDSIRHLDSGFRKITFFPGCRTGLHITYLNYRFLISDLGLTATFLFGDLLMKVTRSITVTDSDKFNIGF